MAKKADGSITVKNRTWNGYFVSCMRDLYIKNELCDVVLTAGNKYHDGDPKDGEIHCHKCVLGAISSYFKSVFIANRNTNYLVVPGVNTEELKNIVCFIYYGEVSVDESSMVGLYRAAILLKSDSLAFQIAKSVTPALSFKLQSLKRHFRKGGEVNPEMFLSVMGDEFEKISDKNSAQTVQEHLHLSDDFLALVTKKKSGDKTEKPIVQSEIHSQSQEPHEKEFSSRPQVFRALQTIGEITIKKENECNNLGVIEVKPIEIKPDSMWAESQDDKDLPSSPLDLSVGVSRPDQEVEMDARDEHPSSYSATSVLRSLLKKKECVPLQTSSIDACTSETSALLSILKQGDQFYLSERGILNSSPSLSKASVSDPRKSIPSDCKDDDPAFVASTKLKSLLNNASQSQRTNKRKSSLKAELFMKEIIENERIHEREIFVPGDHPSVNTKSQSDNIRNKPLEDALSTDNGSDTITNLGSEKDTFSREKRRKCLVPRKMPAPLQPTLLENRHADKNGAVPSTNNQISISQSIADNNCDKNEGHPILFSILKEYNAACKNEPNAPNPVKQEKS